MKIPALIILGLSSTSFLTWGAIEANSTYNKHKYEQKIEQYSQWRGEFYGQKLYDEQFMCPFSDVGACSKEKNKEYLPAPSENWLWEKAYNSYLKDDYSKSLKGINNFEDLKDYCYNEVKNAIYKGKNYFNVSEYSPNDKYHNKCVLGESELTKK